MSAKIFILYFFSFILGLGLSACGIAMNILVAQATPTHLQIRAFAGLHSTYGIASFGAPFLIYISSTLSMKWNEYFIVLSIIPIFVIIILLFFLPNKQLPSTQKSSSMTPPLNLWHRLPYALFFGSYVAAEILVSSRLVLYLKEVAQLSPKESGQLLSLFFFCLTFGRLFFAIFPIKKVSAPSLMQLSLIGSLLCYACGVIYSPWFLPFTGLTMSIFFPVGMSWLNQKFLKGADFMMATVMTSIGFALIIAHYSFGKLAVIYGVELAFTLVPLTLLISLVTLIIILYRNKTTEAS